MDDLVARLLVYPRVVAGVGLHPDGGGRLVEIEGAQRGFAVHEDPKYLNPQSQEWQAFVVRTVKERVTTGL